VVKKHFSKVNIEISNICNLQCSFCPEVVREKKMMSPDVFAKLIPQLVGLTDQVCLHLMGDPLVHPKLEEFIRICEENAMPIFLVTNGTLLREKQSELLLHPIIRQVNFSLHSFPDNFPDKDPTNYLERIFTFTERAFRERPELYINYRIWNLQDTRGTGDQNRDMLARVSERFSVSVKPDVDVTRQKSIRLLNRLYLHFDTEFIWPSLELPVLGVKGTCYGLSNHFGILADGTVVPCCLDKEAAIPLGNIAEESVAAILDSPRAEAILKGFRERKLVEELCQKCQYIERFQ
jgi:radical SAM protein with 4Fe4S-binding SPASM domain